MARARELLRSAGLFDSDAQPLVVISPMRRTLQTALGLFGCDAWAAPTAVQPLAAETSLASRFSAPGIIKKTVASIQQGDHGSSPATLRAMFPPSRHPQLDFATVEDYCARMGPQWASGGAEQGKWWHHGHYGGVEADPAAAERRAAALRAWIASEAAARACETVLLVSHGGMLKLAFHTEHFANAEFRCFELAADGEILQDKTPF